MGRETGTRFFNVGDVLPTSFYGDVEVIDYINSKIVVVRFINTGYETDTTCEQVVSGSVKDRMARTVCGVGYLGDGDYKPSFMERKAYLVWRSMLQRCYMQSENQSSYIGCSVADDWHNFQNFAEWFDDNWPRDGKMYELDKDIKVKGNRIYGPETCLFVTKHENLSEKSVSTTLMNGVTGEIFTFDSIIGAAKATGMSAAQVCRLRKERKGKCTANGWFAIN